MLYVVAEGVSGVGIRAEAWDQFHGTAGGVTWLPEAVNIYSPRWASALAEVVAEKRPALVVIDTFARSIVGADENSAKDVGQAVDHLGIDPRRRPLLHARRPPLRQGQGGRRPQLQRHSRERWRPSSRSSAATDG